MVHNKPTLDQLKLLHTLLESKLTQLAEIQHNTRCTDQDVTLTEAILTFVKYLVDREVASITYYTPGYIPSSSAKPSTICTNCWSKNQNHTHCTHMVVSDEECVERVIMDKFTTKT